MPKIPAVRHDLDIRGQVCPAALFHSLGKLNELHAALSSGEATLEILTDNRDSVTTISDAARNMGHSVTVSRKEAEYALLVEAGNPGEGRGER